MDRNSKHRRRNKGPCECENKEKIYYEAKAGCTDDDSAVAVLPNTWSPRHSGPILANYLKEREQNHEKALQDLAECAKSINEKIEFKIRALAEALLAHIQCNQKDIECIIENCNTGVILEPEMRDEALKNIYQLHARRLDELAHFKREASVVERERADQLRILLRDQFQQLIKIGHCTPRDLLHDFDERAYDINQQLLSNSRAYTELEGRLRVQADESVVMARSAINQLCLGCVIKSRVRSALNPPDEKSARHCSMTPSDGKKRDISSASLGGILRDVVGIDECVLRLVDAYKAAITGVYTGFSDQLNILQKDLGTHSYLVDEKCQPCFDMNFNQMVNKTICRLSNNIHQKNMDNPELHEISGSDMLAMQKSLWSLGECLQDTYNILHDAGHLWDAHILRQAHVQKLTITAVEDTLTSNDKLELANEIAFNLAIEQLRSAPDAEKLQVQYDTIMGMLNHTGEMYRHHSEAELARLEEFMDLLPIMANILLSEFNCFLEKYPRSINSRGTGLDQQGTVSPRSIHAAHIHSPLPRVIFQTELQELALRNWRNGFLESFENNVSLVPEELKRQARLWIEERASVLHMRYSLKMVSHSVRIERIKACREMRLSEILHHESRLASHLQALFEIVQTLPKEASEFSSSNVLLYPFSDRIQEIQKGIDALNSSKETLDPEVKRLKLSSFASRLVKHRVLFEESLNVAIETYRRQLDNRIQNARISNVRFMSQIRLFSEGGRFASQEAAKACNSLVRASDALELCANQIADAINHRRIQLLNFADHQMAPLQRVCDDVLKTGGKGGQGKGQRQTPGRKR